MINFNKTTYELTIKKEGQYYCLYEKHIGSSEGSVWTDLQEVDFTTDFNQIQGLINDFESKLLPHECIEGVIYDYAL